jgi:hypothetical protein
MAGFFENKKLIRDDPVFGRLRYMGDRLKYWEGKTTFAPASMQVEIFVDGDGSSDLAAQRGFYAAIHECWDIIWPTIQKAFAERLQKRFEQKRGAIHFDVLSLDIPLGCFDKTPWELSAGTGADPGHVYVAQMKGKEITGIRLEG